MLKNRSFNNIFYLAITIVIDFCVFFRMKSDAVIAAMTEEHEHNMSNLELKANNLQSAVESDAKKYESEKNIRLSFRYGKVFLFPFLQSNHSVP